MTYGPLVEDTLKLSIWEVAKWFPKGGIERKKEMRFSMTVEGKQVSYTVKLTTTNTHFGSSRLWWVCPLCGKRVGCLYVVDKAKPIACRKCHNLKYEKAVRHRQKDFDEIIKPLSELKRIEKHLQMKWLHEDTIKDLNSKKKKTLNKLMKELSKQN